MLASLVKSSDLEDDKSGDRKSKMHKLLYKFTILMLDEFIYDDGFNIIFTHFYEAEKIVCLSTEADHNMSYGIEFIRRLLIEKERFSPL